MVASPRFQHLHAAAACACAKQAFPWSPVKDGEDSLHALGADSGYSDMVLPLQKHVPRCCLLIRPFFLCSFSFGLEVTGHVPLAR